MRFSLYHPVKKTNLPFQFTKVLRTSAHLILALFLLAGCHRAYRPQQLIYKDYPVNRTLGDDSSINVLLQPYADSVQRSMGALVAVAAVSLEKKKPESTLGNLMADVLRLKAAEKFDTLIDAAFLNYGSIRLQVLPAGNVTLGKLYELSPFDNTIVVLRLTGSQLRAFADIQAAAGGWPCSGVRYVIRNNTALELMIGARPLDESAVYSVATLDYVANGGDNCSLLRPLPRRDKGILFREALISYFAEQHRQGKALNASIEKRVTYAQ
jgi:2',3'-cyclic-nucleotide 2'-phosphodiesterase (5'-nucleotidase family)